MPCSARTMSSYQAIIFFGAISIHCGGHHPVSVMVNTLFLKYTSCCCCCSTQPLRNIPPVATHLKNIHRPCQSYSLSACHLSILHHHWLTRTALCLSKNLVAKLHTMIMFIKPTRINLKGVCNSTLTQNVVVASLVVLQNIIL